MFFKKKKTIQWIRGEKTPVNYFMNGAGNLCGITEEEIFNRRQKNKSLNDALWSICNEYVMNNLSSGNTENIQALYRQMEIILDIEGKNANHIVKKRLFYDLQRYKKEGWPIVIPVCPDECCEACKKIDGKEYNIDEAIKTQPLPPKDCVCQRCRCTY